MHNHQSVAAATSKGRLPPTGDCALCTKHYLISTPHQPPRLEEAASPVTRGHLWVTAAWSVPKGLNWGDSAEPFSPTWFSPHFPPESRAPSVVRVCGMGALGPLPCSLSPDSRRPGGAAGAVPRGSSPPLGVLGPCPPLRGSRATRSPAIARMAALAALAKKVWSARRLLVLLLVPLALLPVLFALPPKVRWSRAETLPA